MSVTQSSLESGRKLVDACLGYENALLTKEIRTRLRGGRAFLLIFAYVFLLIAAVAIAGLIIYSAGQAFRSSSAQSGFPIGLVLFMTLSWTQTGLTGLIAVCLSAGSIGHELRMGTMESIVLTPLTPRNIVVGKVLAPVLYMTMLNAAALPLAAVCMLFGGVSPGQIVAVQLGLAGWTFFLASLGVFVSALCKKYIGWAYVLGLYALYEWVGRVVWISVFTMFGMAGNWQFIYAGICPGAMAIIGMDSAPVFGVPIPAVLVGLAFNVTLGSFLIVAAMTRLPDYNCHKPVEFRMIMLIGSLLGWLLSFGNLAGLPIAGGPGGVLGAISPFAGLTGSGDVSWIMLMLVFIPVIVMIPILATGPMPKGFQLMKCLLSERPRRKIFEPTPLGGMWFLTAWMIGGALIVFLSLAIHGSSIGTGSRGLVHWGTLLGSGFALIVSIVGMTSLGLLISAALSNRALAAVLTGFVLLVIISAAPAAAAVYGQLIENQVWASERSWIWNWSYLWPGLPIAQAAGWLRAGVDTPRMWLPDGLAWLGSTLAWAIVSVGSLGLTARLMRPKGGAQYVG